jgi:hypothetical protein
MANLPETIRTIETQIDGERLGDIEIHLIEEDFVKTMDFIAEVITRDPQPNRRSIITTYSVTPVETETIDG